MNLNDIIIKLMKEIGLDAHESMYDGKRDKYIVFDYEDEQPIAFGDNKVTYDKVFIQVKLIVPKSFNYFSLKKKVRDSLESAGFFVTSISSFVGDIFTETEKQRTVVFKTEYAESREE